MTKRSGVRSPWHWIANLGLFIGLALALGCGVNMSRKAPPLGPDSPKDPPEFDNPQWLNVKSSAPSSILFPPVEINFKKLADSLLGVQILEGDRIWLGVNRRHTLSDPPLGAWRFVGAVGDPNGDIFQPLTIGGATGILTGVRLERGHEYVLALKITRGVVFPGPLVHQVLNVAPFSLDDRSVITTAIGTAMDYPEVNPDKPLGLVHRHPALPFRGACLFKDHLGVVTRPRPGDRAYVTYMGVPISSPTLVNGGLRNESDAYELNVFTNTLNLGEALGAVNGAGSVEFHCETSSGISSKQTLAAGVDYTPPDLSLDEAVMRKLAIGAPLKFFGRCFGGGDVEVAIVPWDLTAKDPLQGNPISQGLVVETLDGFDNDCFSAAPALPKNSLPNLGYQISVSPQKSLPFGTYGVRLRTQDAAGNPSQEGFPFELTPPQAAD